MSDDRPDFDRMTELVRQLEDICREAEDIRARLRAETERVSIWPDRRRPDRFGAHDVTSPSRRQTDPPKN
jgi:hypothetical protein